MAMAQYIPDAVARNDSNIEDEVSLEKRKSVSAAIDGCENPTSSSFDCNICLDFVQDPVVTLCGHLYCWPCIYKWIRFQSASAGNQGNQQPQCPVCKSDISEQSVVPLYGRGQTAKPSDVKGSNPGIVIPSRPPSPRCGTHLLVTTPTTSPSRQVAQQLRHRSHPRQLQLDYPYSGTYAASPMLGLGDMSMTNMSHPIVGMFGEMVYSRIFGNSGTLYAYPDSYHLASNTSPRVRRQIMQTDKSLSRVCFFLCCCIVLCLLLF